jgi:hypothetical protein
MCDAYLRPAYVSCIRLLHIRVLSGRAYLSHIRSPNLSVNYARMEIYITFHNNVRVPFRFRLCGIYGGRSVNRVGFLRVSVSLADLLFHQMLPIHQSSYHPTLHGLDIGSIVK